MIKINFLKGAKLDLSYSSGAEVDIAAGEYIDADDEAQLRKEALKNALILFSGVIGMMIYENTVVPEFRAELRAVQSELDQLTRKNQAAAQAVQQTKKLQKDQELIQKQILAIDNLKKGRERLSDVLEYIQKNVPERLWLNQFDFNEQKLILAGFAQADSDISNFLDSLSKSVVFERVDLIRSQEEVYKDRFRFKKFEIECVLESKI